MSHSGLQTLTMLLESLYYFAEEPAQRRLAHLSHPDMFLLEEEVTALLPGTSLQKRVTTIQARTKGLVFNIVYGVRVAAIQV